MSGLFGPCSYSTESHWDSHSIHGHQLHRTIQPTQWSRRVGIAGLRTFEVFPWLLAYHGTADYTARTLSHGKFCGLIPTRSIAESVFTTHLLQEIRDRRFDLNAIAEALHSAQGTAIPNKTTQARAFHAPLIALITEQLQAHAPAAAEGSALRAPSSYVGRGELRSQSPRLAAWLGRGSNTSFPTKR